MTGETLLSCLDKIVCDSCAAEYAPQSKLFNCDKCGGSLSILYNYEIVAQHISKLSLRNRRGVCQERFIELLPIQRECIVSLGEGGTNLRRCRRIGQDLELDNLFVKDETTNPSGSFKDRAATIAISKAVQFGSKTVVCSSSGNAGCAISAFSAKAGIDCYVCCPADIPRGKLRQIQMYGSKMFLAEVWTSDFDGFVNSASKKFGWYPFATIRSVNPYQWEGPKTIAYEICEQLGWKVPDWVLIPLGGGGNLSAAWKGFVELKTLGLIDSSPAICAVQPEGCKSVVTAYDTREPMKRHETVKTIVKSLEVPYPPDGLSALNAIRESKGCAISVPDSETLEMEKMLASREGLLVEPAGAISAVAARVLKDRGLADRDDTIVFYATGIGFKQPEVFDQICPEPVRIRTFSDFVKNAVE
jgi:threonine synthase